MRRARLVAEVLEGRQLLATITVNSAGDADGADGSDTLSLRQAIEVANGTLAAASLTPAQAGLVDGPLASPNAIRFDIPGPGPFTITPATTLPTITGPVIIDGYSQPGSSPNTNGPGLPDNAVIRVGLDGVEVSGDNDNPFASGLTLTGGHSTVQGLSIGGFAQIDSGIPTGHTMNEHYIGFGIALSDKGGDVVRGNFLGLDTSGNPTDTTFNATGVSASSSDGVGNTIGGTAPSDRNLISGNQTGVSASAGTVVLGNFIGTDPTGTRAIGSPGGLSLELPVGYPAGIESESSDVTIGGITSGAGNVISGNQTGIVGLGLIQGNLIGTDLTGTRPLGNQTGIHILEDGVTTVLGPTAVVRNVISGNSQAGISFDFNDGDNLVQGNYIGTDATGTRAVPNRIGIQAADYLAGTVGGTAFGAGNVISGNVEDGISVDSLTHGNPILGNFIGTGPDGTTPLPNGGNGIAINGNNNTIGGTASGSGNVIAFNGKSGILIKTVVAPPLPGYYNQGNRISGNSIFGNGALGIDLGGDGVTPNNPAGSPTGPNRLQPYPVITATPIFGALTTISATLDALPSTPYTVEFFVNDTPDPSGFGQGQFYVGSTVATTDAAGHVGITFTTIAGTIDRFISATATGPQGDTSEFARDLPSGVSATTTTLVAPDPVATVGVPITLTAVVATTADGVPTGSVAFLDGGVAIGSAPLDASGVATFAASALTAGPHQIAASYGGDAAHEPSLSGAVTVGVTPALAPSFTSLAGPGQVVRLGRPATLYASVGAAAGGVPFGPVQFLVDGAVIGRGILDTSGVATLVTSGLTPGTHAISAAFAGDIAHGPSSATEAVTVLAPRAFAGPAVTSAVFVGPRSVTIAFNRGLMAGPARDPANYAIIGPGHRPVAILSAAYDPATASVILATRRKLDPRQSYRLTIRGRRVGGVVDVFGIPLDGKDDGRPGHDYTGKVSAGRAPVVKAAHPSGPKAKSLATAHAKAVR